MAEIAQIKLPNNATPYDLKDAVARTGLGGKQDTISDLDQIRSGAALGATAL